MQFQFQPRNIHPQVWNLFCMRNPHPQKLIPIAVQGYEQLQKRSEFALAGHITCNKAYAQLNKMLDDIKIDIAVRMKRTILELKEVQLDLSLRLLMIFREYICEQTVNTVGIVQNEGQVSSPSIVVGVNGRSFEKEMPFTVQELRLKKRMHDLLITVHEVHEEFKAIDSRMIRMRAVLSGIRSGGGQKSCVFNYDLNENDIQMKAMKIFFTEEQKMISYMVNTVKKDMQDLNIMKLGMPM